MAPMIFEQSTTSPTTNVRCFNVVILKYWVREKKTLDAKYKTKQVKQLNKQKRKWVDRRPGQFTGLNHSVCAKCTRNGIRIALRVKLKPISVGITLGLSALPRALLSFELIAWHCGRRAVAKYRRHARCSHCTHRGAPRATAFSYCCGIYIGDCSVQRAHTFSLHFNVISVKFSWARQK